jgi:tetratricopeptide (TPR) repeat protein/type II secretory pathway predicted ATPase ExeA
MRCPDHELTPPAEPAPPRRPIPEIAGYRVTDVLGEGGFGTVYAAEGPSGPVAIKTALREMALADARLRREAEALRRIGPPHVPQLLDEGDLDDGTHYVIMDLVSAPTLAFVLADRPPLTPAEALPIARGIAEALRAAHERGLVHRDLKPDNIFVDGSQVMLVDFGLVKQVGPAVDVSLTALGSIVGSATYMSPEQAVAGGAIDERTDVYSLGVVLYEMLAGRPPFLGGSTEVVQAHLARRPPRLGTLAPIPERLETLVHRCLAKPRDDRPASAAELIAELDACAALVDEPAAIPTPAAAARAAAGAATREKRMAGLLFFRSATDARATQQLVAAFGGHVARSGGAFAVVFDHEAGDNPARRALLAAQALVAQRIADTAVVDAAPVTYIPRPDGGRRYVSALFNRDESFPQPSDPSGVLVTSRSADLVGPASKERIEGRELYVLGTDAVEPRRDDVLVGRDGELEALARSAARALTGVPTLCTVIGGVGAGKSRLLEAAVQQLRADQPDARVIELAGHETLGGAGGGSTRELVRLVLELGLERPADGGRALLDERLGPALAAETWPGVAVALDWATAGDPQVKAVAAAPGVLRGMAARAVGLALQARAQTRPVIVVVDDAHLLDLASLDALELATLEERARPIWVCVAARPELASTRPNWGLRAAVHQRVEIGPLPDDAAAELMRRLLAPAEDVPKLIIDRLVTRTHGVPLVLVELARGIRREGRIRQHAKGGTFYLASDGLDLPDLPLVEWLASRELASLAPALARHARLLALLGSDFSRAEVAGILAEIDRGGAGDELPLDGGVAIARLIAAGLVLERPGGRLAFRSAIVRGAIAQATPPPLATMIHEAAYRWYRDHHDPAALAHHAARAGHPRESAATYLELARDAEARHAYLDAEVAYSRALEQREHLDGPDAEARALRGRGLMRFRLFRYDDARVDLEAARALALARGDRATELTILLDEATILDFLYDWPRMRAVVDEARALAAAMPAGPGPVLAARLTFNLGRTACRFSEDADAARLLLEAAAAAEALGDPGYETYETIVVSLLQGAYVLATLGRLDEAEAAYARVLPLVTARGDQLHVAAVLISRFLLWAARDQPDRMLDDLSRALQICREIGIPHLEVSAQQTLALCLHWTGREDDAERHARRAIQVDDRIMGDSARMESRLILARILAARGELAGARLVLDEVAARLAAARARGDGALELVPAEQVFHDLVALRIQGGTPPEWRALAERARQVLTGKDLDEVLRLV